MRIFGIIDLVPSKTANEKITTKEKYRNSAGISNIISHLFHYYVSSLETHSQLSTRNQTKQQNPCDIHVINRKLGVY